MHIRFSCPQCGASVKVDARHAGKRGKCPSCGTSLHIPTAEAIQAARARHAQPTSEPTPESADLAELPASAPPKFDDDDFDFTPEPPPEITTPQPAAHPAHSYDPYLDAEKTTGELSYAGFWKRFVAFWIDGFILGFLQFGVGVVIGFTLAFLAAPRATIESVAQLAGIVVYWLYFALQESSEHQATLGKRALRIRVVDLQGQPIGFGRATGRHFGKILSSFLLMFGFIMAAFTEKKQALHDILAGCLVVNR